MANWNRELYVVEKMLDADARNCEGPLSWACTRLTIRHKVHAWNYRRYILSEMPVKRSEASELVYTTKKIEANFSNFSAWHHRSKNLQTMWEAGALDPAKSKEEGMQFSTSPICALRDPAEFDLVKNAMYTDPNDQSVWIYHRWLIGTGMPSHDNVTGQCSQHA